MKIQKIYWDSDCFLGHLKAEPDKAEQCEVVIERAENGEILIVTSALTLAEVLWMKKAPKLTAEKAKLVRQFFQHSYIRVHNVTRHIAEAAQEYVWYNDIRPKDAIHVATAIELHVDALETFDQSLIQKSGTVGTPPLKIREPQASSQQRLNLKEPAAKG